LAVETVDVAGNSGELFTDHEFTNPLGRIVATMQWGDLWVTGEPDETTLTKPPPLARSTRSID
jgi:hypothetical protein